MHLLVIEDDPRLVRLLRRLLEEDRHVVETATDGESGLEIAEATTGIEAVILDIGLPDISGLEVARRLRARGIRSADPDADRARHRRATGSADSMPAPTTTWSSRSLTRNSRPGLRALVEAGQ